MSGDSNALNLHWTFGINTRCGVHNLTDENRNVILYASAHTAVLYDFASRTQKLLQGHCNEITSCAVSDDKRWIATADVGSDSMIVIWDSENGNPVKTIFDPHEEGILAMDISADAMHLATLSAPSDNGTQTVSIWDWTNDHDGPIYSAEISSKEEHDCIKFNPSDREEFVTNGAHSIVFWSSSNEKLTGYAPVLSAKDFEQAIKQFTQTVFIPNSTQAVTGTTSGDAILWDRSIVGLEERLAAGPEAVSDRRAVKIMALGKTSLQTLHIHGNYLIVGCSDGSVRFFDFGFRVISWFEDLSAGPIASISFALQGAPDEIAQDSVGNEFWTPDFIVSTSSVLVVGVESASFFERDSSKKRGTLLLQGFKNEVPSLAIHPNSSMALIGSSGGDLQLWNYEEKRLTNVRRVENIQPQCIEFDPLGTYVAIGDERGRIKILDAITLDDTANDFISPSKSAIESIKFSKDGQYMVCSDASFCIWLLHLEPRKSLPTNVLELYPDQNEPEDLGDEWILIGRNRCHNGKINGISFLHPIMGPGESNMTPRLITTSEDKHLCEFDIKNSSPTEGLKLLSRTKIEQEAQPTSTIWYPRKDGDREILILTANNHSKFKLWNATNKTCRKTVLAPTFGGALIDLIALTPADANAEITHLVYATEERVVGLIRLPLDGNPNRSMAMVAHPGTIACMKISPCGRFLFTSGGADATVNMWRLNTNALDDAVVAGGGGIVPFLSLLEGGAEGETMQEIEQYFCYSQLRAQGENTSLPRKADGKVPISEIPNLMRSLGYYPSEEEVKTMCSEVKYSKFTDNCTTIEDIEFEDFIKLFINHRPVNGITREDITEAFTLLSNGRNSMSWRSLASKLKTNGEPMTSEELDTCLSALLGLNVWDVDDISANELTEQVLGFENFGDEQQDELGGEEESIFEQ